MLPLLCFFQCSRAVGSVILWPITLTLVPSWVWGAQCNGWPRLEWCGGSNVVQFCAPFGMTFPAPVENFLFHPNISILTGISHSIHIVGCSNITHLPAGKTVLFWQSFLMLFPFAKKGNIPKIRLGAVMGRKQNWNAVCPGKAFVLFLFPSRAGSLLHKGSSWAASANVSKIEAPRFFLETKALPTVPSLWENHS